MAANKKGDPNENVKIGAAAVGGAVVGAVGAVLATNVLSDPKKMKKIKNAFEGAKEQVMDTLESLKEKAGELNETAQNKIEEAKKKLNER